MFLLQFVSARCSEKAVGTFAAYNFSHAIQWTRTLTCCGACDCKVQARSVSRHAATIYACRLQGRISEADFARLNRRRVSVADESAQSFFRLLRPGSAARVPGQAVLPPFTIVVAGNAKERDALYEQVKRRADFAAMCNNQGLLDNHVRAFKTTERFYGCANVHNGFAVGQGYA